MRSAPRRRASWVSFFSVACKLSREVQDAVPRWKVTFCVWFRHIPCIVGNVSLQLGEAMQFLCSRTLQEGRELQAAQNSSILASERLEKSEWSAFIPLRATDADTLTAQRSSEASILRRIGLCNEANLGMCGEKPLEFLSLNLPDAILVRQHRPQSSGHFGANSDEFA